ILQIRGVFASSPTRVVLSDLMAFYVVPTKAMSVSNNEIDVNLSQIAGLACDPASGANCLGFLDDMLVTVNQGCSSGGISDSAHFRYAPGPPGSYNPAPTQ